MLDEDVVLPDQWTKKRTQIQSTDSNRPSALNLSVNQSQIVVDSNKINDMQAGVPSGFVERFELEKYNPKIIKEPVVTFKPQRPYTTQNGMNAFRLQKDRQAIQAKMDEWEKLNPYYVDYKYPKDSASPQGDKPKTVKEKQQEKVQYFRAQNGLDLETHPVDLTKEDDYKIPLTCKSCKISFG